MWDEKESAQWNSTMMSLYFFTRKGLKVMTHLRSPTARIPTHPEGPTLLPEELRKSPFLENSSEIIALLKEIYSCRTKEALRRKELLGKLRSPWTGALETLVRSFFSAERLPSLDLLPGEEPVLPHPSKAPSSEEAEDLLPAKRLRPSEPERAAKEEKKKKKRRKKKKDKGAPSPGTAPSGEDLPPRAESPHPPTPSPVTPEHTASEPAKLEQK
jgi:hypothetical protein